MKSGLTRSCHAGLCREQLWACQALFRCNPLYAGLTGLRSGIILKIEFRNVVGGLVVVPNREFQVFVGVRFCIKGRRVVFTAAHLQALTCSERRSRTTHACMSQDMSQTLVYFVFCRDTQFKTQCCGMHLCGPTLGRHQSINSGVRYA